MERDVRDFDPDDRIAGYCLDFYSDERIGRYCLEFTSDERIGRYGRGLGADEQIGGYDWRLLTKNRCELVPGSATLLVIWGSAGSEKVEGSPIQASGPSGASGESAAS